jgi:hypothetical protein
MKSSVFLIILVVTGSQAQGERSLFTRYANRSAGVFSHYLGGGAGYLRGRFASIDDRKSCENTVGYAGEVVGSTVAGLSTGLVKAAVSGASLATVAASFGGTIGFCILGPPGTLPGAALAGSIGAVVGATGGFLFEIITTDSIADGGSTGKKAAIDWTCPTVRNCTLNQDKTMNDGRMDTWPLVIENGTTKSADGSGRLQFTEGQQLKLVCNGTGNFFVNFDYLLQNLTVECKFNETFTQDGMDENFYDFFCKQNTRTSSDEVTPA